MDDQAYLRMNKAERAAEDERRGAALAAGLAAAARSYRENADATRGVVRLAAEAHEKARGDEFYEPRRREALETATEIAETWEARAKAAEGGRLLLTQVEMGDIEYMKSVRDLIPLASRADVVSYERES